MHASAFRAPRSARGPHLRRVAGLAAALLAACVRIPEGTEAVRGFELERYLGTWYEIARLDHRFERGLVCVTATYRSTEGGGIRVVNRGWDPQAGAWEEAVGRAYPVGEPDVGRLKVSFFGPFYGGYNVLALDPDYRHALVAGPSRDYLWILAREPRLPSGTRHALVERARALGFPVEELLWVEQSPDVCPDRVPPPRAALVRSADRPQPGAPPGGPVRRAIEAGDPPPWTVDVQGHRLWRPTATGWAPTTRRSR